MVVLLPEWAFQLNFSLFPYLYGGNPQPHSENIQRAHWGFDKAFLSFFIFYAK